MNELKVIKLSDLGQSLGTRELGREIRENALISIKKENAKIFFDFSNVHIISSAFADELFGKLFNDLGRDVFLNNVKINKFTNGEDKKMILLIIKRALEFRNTQAHNTP